MAAPAKARHAAWRARQREAGLVRREVYIHHTNIARLEKYALKLEKPITERKST